MVGLQPMLHNAASFQPADEDKRELDPSAGRGDAIEIAGVAAPQAGAHYDFVPSFYIIIHLNTVAGKPLFKEDHVFKGIILVSDGGQGGAGQFAAGHGMGVKAVQKSSLLHVLPFG